jgi:hypothetical protein
MQITIVSSKQHTWLASATREPNLTNPEALPMNINEIKNQISEMTYDELELKFELYSELESRDAFTEVMQELLAIELDRRESED